MWLHAFSYKYIGILSQRLEKDRLHPKHRLTDYHKWFIDRVRADWTVLDLGCGNGSLSFDLKKRSRKVIAIDKDETNINKAKSTYSCEGLEYFLGDIEGYHFKGIIDAIILSNVLEHIKERVVFLKRLRQFSKRFLIRVPAFDRDWLTPYKKELGAEWRLDPTHYIEYTLEGLRKELSQAGLSIVEWEVRFGEYYVLATAE